MVLRQLRIRTICVLDLYWAITGSEAEEHVHRICQLWKHRKIDVYFSIHLFIFFNSQHSNLNQIS
uniref:Ovule protein n=1 Tax=Meloidogyne incognita TaxID=6306 RepID=A0A914N255_MELIC